MTKRADDHNTDQAPQTTDIRQFLSLHYTMSKRQLGILLMIGGALAFIGMLLPDIIGIGREGGIGPAQQLALAGAVLVILIGASLLPLGDDPA